MDNKYTQKDIVDALNIIKSTCISYEHCVECPFIKYNKCMIIENCPDEWNLISAEQNWKAFK